MIGLGLSFVCTRLCVSVKVRINYFGFLQQHFWSQWRNLADLLTLWPNAELSSNWGGNASSGFSWKHRSWNGRCRAIALYKMLAWKRHDIPIYLFSPASLFSFALGLLFLSLFLHFQFAIAVYPSSLFTIAIYWLKYIYNCNILLDICKGQWRTWSQTAGYWNGCAEKVQSHGPDKEPPWAISVWHNQSINQPVNQSINSIYITHL